MLQIDDAAAHAMSLMCGDAPKQAVAFVAGNTNIIFSSSHLNQRILWFVVKVRAGNKTFSTITLSFFN